MGKQNQIKSYNLIVVFVSLFLLLITISIIFKIINLFEKSTFDGENHFTISVEGKDKNASLISFAPKSNAIYILNIIDGKNKNLSSALEIPIDSEINTDTKINDKNIKAKLFSFLIPFTIKESQLTFIDLFRLWLFTNSVPSNSIYQQEISTDDQSVKLKDSTVYSYFTDQGIAEEKVSIEVVNGTDVFGLGNKLASFLSNTGANVVMVSTADKEEKVSRIDYFGKESYTLRKLSRLLGFKINLVKKRSLADITIIIGEDALDRIKF
jgi:hypothetical protein